MIRSGNNIFKYILIKFRFYKLFFDEIIIFKFYYRNNVAIKNLLFAIHKTINNITGKINIIYFNNSYE